MASRLIFLCDQRNAREHRLTRHDSDPENVKRDIEAELSRKKKLDDDYQRQKRKSDDDIQKMFAKGIGNVVVKIDAF